MWQTCSVFIVAVKAVKTLRLNTSAKNSVLQALKTTFEKGKHFAIVKSFLCHLSSPGSWNANLNSFSLVCYPRRKLMFGTLFLLLTSFRYSLAKHGAQWWMLLAILRQQKATYCFTLASKMSTKSDCTYKRLLQSATRVFWQHYVPLACKSTYWIMENPILLLQLDQTFRNCAQTLIYGRKYLSQDVEESKCFNGRQSTRG